MCRLFCSLSMHEKSPYADIFESKYSILKQSEIEGHRDGWGAYAYEGTKLGILVRRTAPLCNSLSEAMALAKSISSTCSGFFIRDASNPLGLDRDKIISIDATQPFTYNNIAFMHNGTVRAPDRVMKELKDPFMLPRSSNDSEIYFIIFIKYLSGLKDAYKSLVAAERFITEAYAKSNDKPAYSSLNAIVADGTKVYAFNKYTKTIAKSVSDPERDFYKMCFKSSGSDILIASEPLDDSEWKDLGNGKMLEAWIEDGNIKYKVNNPD